MVKPVLSIFVSLLAVSCTLPCAVNAQCWIYSYSGTTSWLNGISFSDPRHGFIVGENGTVRQTGDGGATWKLRNFKTTSPLYAVDCIDSNTITLVGYSIEDGLGLIYRSTNGGTSYAKQGTGTTEVFSAVSFLNRDTGLVVGTGGTIFFTTDGGAGWRPRVSGSTNDLRGVAFLNKRLAIAVGGFGSILRSTNSGSTWTTFQTGLGALNAVTFVDSSVGYIVGTNGTILKTTNSGADWIDESINSEYFFYAASFADANRGTAVGYAKGNGVIAHTSDGGMTWARVLIHDNALFGVSIHDSTVGTAVSWSGGILHEANNCSQAGWFTQELPANGSAHEPLVTSVSSASSVTLQWNLLPDVHVAGTMVELGTDSTFTSGILVNTLVTLKASLITRKLIVFAVQPGITCYWRLIINYDDGSSTGWSDVWKFTTANGSVGGYVFEDVNRDSLWNPGERSLNGWQVDLTGTHSNSVLTDSLGRFQFSGIDSGSYVVNAGLPLVWFRTAPRDTVFRIVMGSGDSIGGLTFGNYFPWNTVSGNVFDDRNENGVQDNGEPGLSNWWVRVRGNASDSAVTDANGQFMFSHLTLGTMTVTSVPQQSWEQINPQLGGSYTMIMSSYDQHIGGKDFSIHRIPPRIKMALFVKDSTSFAHRDIWWGVRPGATAGIWSADSLATNADFSEGEFDLPPQTFGLFDARFELPPAGAGVFGYGSWTDMREYSSPTQVDTYRVTFNPGYFFGGDYPMTLRWSKAGIDSSYDGPVVMTDSHGVSVNMKTIESFVVSDHAIKSITIIASSPHLPVVGVNGPANNLPREFMLEQNYPNPFNPVTTITYQIPHGERTGPPERDSRAGTSLYRVSLVVYNLLGQTVAVLVDAVEEAGVKAVTWDASSLPSGVYCYRLAVRQRGGNGVNNFVGIKKMLLIK